jgi:hypothetical protein
MPLQEDRVNLTAKGLIARRDCGALAGRFDSPFNRKIDLPELSQDFGNLGDNNSRDCRHHGVHR